jgi:hypothetical protein
MADLATSALEMAIDSRGAAGQVPTGSSTATTAPNSAHGPSLNAPAALDWMSPGEFETTIRPSSLASSPGRRGLTGLSTPLPVRLPQQEVVLIGSAAEVHEARPRLARVGIDGVVGAVTDLHALSEHPELVSTQSSSPRGRRRRGSSR